MASITVAGASNWRAAFEGHPGLAVTPENYDRLMAGAGAVPEPEPVPEAVPDPEPAPEAPGPEPEPAAPPRTPPRRAAEDGG